MKKLIALFTVGLMLISLCTLYSAADKSNGLPFELVAPKYVYAVWQEGDDSPTTTKLTYSLSNEMTTFHKNMNEAHLNGTIEQFMKDAGCDEVWMNIQVDWALDDVNDGISGWHYTKYWDGDPYFGLGHDSEGNSRWSEWDIVDGSIGNAEETVNDLSVTRCVPNDDRWNGNPETHTPGVKDQLRVGQYVYDEEIDTVRIDYTQHTMYFRMRFVVTVRNEGEQDKFYFSEWSNTACVGKDAVKLEPLTKADLPAPVITGLRMTDKEFNGNPIVAFTLTVPEKLADDASKVEADGGGIVIEVEGRVKGDTEFVGLQGDWIIRAGEMECALFALASEARPNVPKDAIIELRCRYRYDHPKYETEIYSDWSKIISFGTDDINYYTDPGDDTTGDPEDPGKVDPNKKTCPICRFCPQPLGLCIFIWLLIILVAVAVMIIIIVVNNKKKKDKKQ